MRNSKIMRKEIRLSEREFKRLEADAKELGMNVSEYIRYLVRNKPGEHPEVAKLFKQLINEINHIGNNVNQLTRKSNAGIFTEKEKKVINAYMKSINENVEKVIDMYGNK